MQLGYSLDNQSSLKTLYKQAHLAIRQDAIQLKNANLCITQSSSNRGCHAWHAKA